MGKKEIGALTGLRALAAIWVLLCHARLFVWISPDASFRNAIFFLGRSGYLGVDIFFVLSGFVLAYTYAEHRVHATSARYLSFLRKRLARIYPLHVFTMALLAAIALLLLPALGIWFPNSWLLKNDMVVQNLLLTHAWHLPASPSWNPPAWSISAEWAAYLAFPWIVLAANKVSDRRIALLFILLLFLAQFAFQGVSPTQTDASYGLIRIATEFPAGVLLYRVHALRGSSYPLDRWAIASMAAMFGGSALLDWWLGKGASTSLFPILGCAIVYALANSRERVAQFMSSSTMLYLGRISYAIYMVHFIVYVAGEAFIRDAGIPGTSLATLAIVAMIVGSVVMAAALYHCVEVPCRQWILASRNQPESATVAWMPLNRHSD